eukprot:COSAG06_NODE_641_length_13489_cov_4.330769_13_plen_82_part_00
MSMMAVRQRTKQATDQAMVTETQVRTTLHRVLRSLRLPAQHAARELAQRAVRRARQQPCPTRSCRLTALTLCPARRCCCSR